MAHGRKLLAMEAECERFNKAHPINSDIRVFPGARGIHPATLVTIIEPGAYVLSGHTPVVQVSGGRGCIALTHVLPEEQP